MRKQERFFGEVKYGFRFVDYYENGKKYFVECVNCGSKSIIFPSQWTKIRTCRVCRKSAKPDLDTRWTNVFYRMKRINKEQGAELFWNSPVEFQLWVNENNTGNCTSLKRKKGEKLYTPETVVFA